MVALMGRWLTTFAYDGDSNRLLMSIAGEVTTYTLDYGHGKQILLKQGGAYAQTKHYLYGLSCIGELVDAGDPETEEWRYYQRDGNNLVRQTTNSAAEITLAWAYSPDGAVLIGAKGPVTNLGCGDIYDWSTGLVYKDGRYFDPTLGIWLTLAPFVVWQKYKLGKRRGKSKRKRRDRKQLFLLFLFLLVVTLALAGCGGSGVGLELEELDTDTICSPQKPDDLSPLSRGSQKVNIEHVSGPNPTPLSGYDWRVKFVLDEPARRDGWIIQEINYESEVYEQDGTVVFPYPLNLQFWEAWEVTKGKKERDRFPQTYDDRYYSPDNKEGRRGITRVVGIVKFYEGGLGAGFREGNVWLAGDLHSSWTAPRYWDYVGTAHNFEIDWDGQHTKGLARWGNQQYTWDTSVTP